MYKRQILCFEIWSWSLRIESTPLLHFELLSFIIPLFFFKLLYIVVTYIEYIVAETTYNSTTMSTRTIHECLAILNITVEMFQYFNTLEEEWSFIKKQFFKLARTK